MYFNGVSYRRTAELIETHFGRKTNPVTIWRWVEALTTKARARLDQLPVPVGSEWVADELAVKVGGRQFWVFNVMDSETRFVLAARLSLERGARAAATTLSLARRRAANPPKVVKTDGLASYRQGVAVAFPVHGVRHVVSQGIRAEINNNLSERLQGTLRDRDKTLRALKRRKSGQIYIDGLTINYNYFRKHQALGMTPAQFAGAATPFRSWVDVAQE